MLDEALEGLDQVGAVRPGTKVVDVEDVAALFGGEGCLWGAGDGGAEGRVFAPEVAVAVGVFVDFGGLACAKGQL